MTNVVNKQPFKRKSRLLDKQSFMKNFMVLLIVMSLVIISCEKNEINPNFNFGVEKSFQIKDNYFSADENLKFKIAAVNDSRCPSDVVCIWEGKADVTIEIESPQTGTIILSTYNNLIDTIGNYSFELKDVSPYPISTKTIKLEDYEITLNILELEN